MRGLVRDIRYAVRSLSRRPGFAAVAVVTLALGIGVNTSVFSLANWLLLRPVPGVQEPDRLTRIQLEPDENPGVFFYFSHTLFDGLRQRLPAVTGLVGVAAYAPVEVHLTAADAPTRRIPGELVSEDFFEVLGVEPVLGRRFLPDESSPGGRASVVLSHRLWRTAFGGDRDAVGASLTLNGRPYTVVGVAPPGFHGAELPGTAELWVPLGRGRDVVSHVSENYLENPSSQIWHVIVGRLGAGAEADALQAGLARVEPRLQDATSMNLERRSFRAYPGIGIPPTFRERMRHTLGLLMAMAGFVLLLAVANTVNLALARASARREDLRVRRALGAGRGRIVRGILTENLVLAAVGGLVGLGASMLLVDLFEGMRLVRWGTEIVGVGVDRTVFAFAAVATLVVGVLVGGTAGIAASGENVSGPLRRGRRGGQAGGRLRSLLVGAQVAISVILVVGAGLLVRTLQELHGVEMGLDPSGVVTLSLDPGVQGYEEEDVVPFGREVLDRVEADPAVGSAAVAWINIYSALQAGARVFPYGEDPEGAVWTQANRVSRSFFETLGIEVVDGRIFPDRHGGDKDAPRMVVVNDRLARELFPSGVAVGRTLGVRGRGDTPFEIVGIVRDARLQHVEEPPEHWFFEPLGQGFPLDRFTLLVRAAGETGAMIPRVRSLVRDLDPGLPAYDVTTLPDRIDRTLSEQRVVAFLSALFAGLAVVLAAVGLYGVLSHAVVERTREFGVRQALGARAGQVLAMVMGSGLRTTALGVGVGLVGATQLTRFLESRLFGVEPFEPGVYVVGVALLLVLAVGASLAPAWRAVRVDPNEALRAE